MVTRRFVEGLSWLHARVGRQIPLELTAQTDRSGTNSHVKAKASAVALQPTVYLPSALSGYSAFSLIDSAA
jgi:hypothetical protein